MKINCRLVALLFVPFLSCNQATELPQASLIQDSLPNQEREQTGTANLVFRSTDGGETWQDISDGLPESVREDNEGGQKVFFADANGLWLSEGSEIYHSNPSFTAPYWTKATLPDGNRNITPGKAGIYAYNSVNGIVQKAIGADDWRAVFPDLQTSRVRSVLETEEGIVFISSDEGLFRSADRGVSWQEFPASGLGMNLVESEGVLLTTGTKGIIRSTDNGESWQLVIKEDGAGIAVSEIEGGFAAINYSAETNTRRVRTSYDGGKTWQAIDADLPAQLSISSIVQAGKYLFCGHPLGIFRSSDKGKTWDLLVPSLQDRVFNLAVSGDVIYAIPRSGGC